MSTPEDIANRFIQLYYTSFDTDRSALHGLYRAKSMLTFEGDQYLGADSIIKKLISLPFEKVLHKVLTSDVQPSHESIASLIVSVTGQLLVDDSSNPLQFSQIFHLMPDGASYYVFNDMFRLNYG